MSSFSEHSSHPSAHEYVTVTHTSAVLCNRTDSTSSLMAFSTSLSGRMWYYLPTTSSWYLSTAPPLYIGRGRFGESSSEVGRSLCRSSSLTTSSMDQIRRCVPRTAHFRNGACARSWASDSLPFQASTSHIGIACVLSRIACRTVSRVVGQRS